MIRRHWESRDDKQVGFTLVELLVTVLFLGVLAAIALPTFLAVRDRGYEATVRSDLRNGATAMEIWRSFSDDGRYPSGGQLSLPRTEPDVTLSIVVPGAGDSGEEFCIEGAHARLNGGAVVATYDQRFGGLTDNDSC